METVNRRKAFRRLNEIKYPLVVINTIEGGKGACPMREPHRNLISGQYRRRGHHSLPPIFPSRQARPLPPRRSPPIPPTRPPTLAPASHYPPRSHSVPSRGIAGTPTSSRKLACRCSRGATPASSSRSWVTPSTTWPNVSRPSPIPCPPRRPPRTHVRRPRLYR